MILYYIGTCIFTASVINTEHLSLCEWIGFLDRSRKGMSVFQRNCREKWAQESLRAPERVRHVFEICSWRARRQPTGAVDCTLLTSYCTVINGIPYSFIKGEKWCSLIWWKPVVTRCHQRSTSTQLIVTRFEKVLLKALEQLEDNCSESMIQRKNG